MNNQVLIDRVFLQDLLFLIKQPRTKIDARAVLVFGIERALATPAPIPDAGEGVDVMQRIERHTVKAGECPSNSEVVLLSSLHRIVSALQSSHSEDVRAMVADPSPAGVDGLEVVSNWVLFDAEADTPYIKKMLPEGFLAFFDCEEDARRAKANNPGTDYKRIDRVKAEDAQRIIDGQRGENEALQTQVKVLQSDANSWQSGYDEGRRMGGKHCMLTVDQLRAELAALNAKLDASKFCADVADDLLAELADAKETISRYEVTAENCDVLRAELANQLEVKAFWIGRTRALEVELAEIRAQEPVG